MTTNDPMTQERLDAIEEQVTLLRLFDELGVATQESEMSMSVRADDRVDRRGGLEYAGALGASGLFPTWQHALRPRYLRMLAEVPRFHRMARRLLAAAEDYRPGPTERVEDWLLTNAVADDRFRGRLLRYMDVLASLDRDRDAKRLAQEYFGDDFPALPFPLRWLIRIARDEHLVVVRLIDAS